MPNDQQRNSMFNCFFHGNVLEHGASNKKGIMMTKREVGRCCCGSGNGSSSSSSSGGGGGG